MSLLRRFFNLTRSRRLSRDIEREIAFHINEHTDELIASGVSPNEARAQARRRFGNSTVLGERTRDADIVTWLDSFAADVRYGLRTLRRSPVFATVAVLSLALAIGANSAIYSLLDAVVLRPLATERPNELVLLTDGGAGAAGPAVGKRDWAAWFTNPIWEGIRDNLTGVSALAAFAPSEFNTSEGGLVRRINGEFVSGDYFKVLATVPHVGRLLSAADDVRGCAPIAVLGHGFWQSEYGGQRDVIGSAIRLDGVPFEIVGVTAQNFQGLEIGRTSDILVPLCSEAALRGERSALDRRSTWWLRVFGRKAPGVTTEELRSRLEAISPGVFAATVPDNWARDQQEEYRTRSIGVRDAATGVSFLRDRYAESLGMMMKAVGLLLLIACANVANLLLARATAREREVAIRLAVGAGRKRLVRQMLTESAMLALFGAIGGLILARWGAAALVSMISTNESQISLDLSLNPQILGFTVLVAGGAAILFGLAPVWRSRSVSAQSAMKARGVGTSGATRGFTLNKALVAAQVALSLTLLAGAGLLVGSLRNLQNVDPGFTTEGVFLVSANLSRTSIPRESYANVQDRIRERLRSLPGVQATSYSDRAPIGRSSWNDILVVDGFHGTTFQDSLVWFNEVSEGFFQTLEIPLIAGRDFDATDVPGAGRNVIVSQAVGDRFYATSSPLGKTFRLKLGDSLSDPYTIVGVVANSKYQQLREENVATVYQTSSQNASRGPSTTFEVRAAGGTPSAILTSIRQVFSDFDRQISLEITTLGDRLTLALSRERVLAVLSTLFGAVALALSMLGLYGVMAYTVARRQNEIGVRIALGADRRKVLSLVLSDVVRLVVIGLVLGLAGAAASGRLVRAFLYGVTPSDPVILTIVVLLLSVLALLAGLIPAMRASRVDPVAALRDE